MQKKLTNFIYIILGVLLISFILWNRTSGNNPLTPRGGTTQTHTQVTSPKDQHIGTEVASRDYASYSINSPSPFPSGQQLKNNPIIKKKNKNIVHDELVKHECNEPGCDGKFCKGFCSLPTRRRLHSINAGLDSDKVDYPYKPILDKCEAYLNSNKSIYEIHNNIQDELWTGLQCHPLYNRSISFIFIKQVVYSPLTETEDAFRNHFVSLLGDKMYDLNSRQDCRDVYKAMLIAYKTQVDSKVIDKLYQLHHKAGITLNTHFLHDMANLLKHGLL